MQDLKFETATTRIKSTPDGEYLIASGKFSFYFVFLVKNVLWCAFFTDALLNESGIYPPQVKVYELGQLALKFERHLDSEIVDFEVTSLLRWACVLSRSCLFLVH